MRNIDYIVKVISKEKGYKESDVDKVLKFYWKDLRNEMSKLDTTSFFIRNLGTFSMTNALVCREITRLITWVRRKPEKQEYIYKYLRALLAVRPIVSKIYYERFNKTVLGEQEGNSGGDTKPD